MALRELSRQGNVLLDELLGAVVIQSKKPTRFTKSAGKAAQRGHRVYEIPAGGSGAIGALGYPISPRLVGLPRSGRER